MNLRVLVTILFLGIASGLVLSCASADAQTPAPVEETAIVVTGAWLRPGIDPTAAYMTIINTGDSPVTLTGASASWADSVGIHETVDRDGFLVMQHAESIIVPARSAVILRPGGYHLMAQGIHRAIKVDDSVEIQLITDDDRQVSFVAVARAGG